MWEKKKQKFLKEKKERIKSLFVFLSIFKKHYEKKWVARKNEIIFSNSKKLSVLTENLKRTRRRRVCNAWLERQKKIVYLIFVSTIFVYMMTSIFSFIFFNSVIMVPRF